MPSLAPVITAIRPSRRKEGSWSSLGTAPALLMDSRDKRLPRACRGYVQRVHFIHKALVEGIRGVDVDAVFRNDVIVFQTNAANSGFSRVRLKVKRHTFLEHD